MRTYCISPKGHIHKVLKRITGILLILIVTIFLYPNSGWTEEVSLKPIKDTFVDQSDPTKSYGSSTPLEAKDGSIEGGGKIGSSTKETLFQFDLSGIPQGAQITRAYLKLFSYKKGNFEKDNATRAYAILSNWSESTTWKTKPARASTYEDSIAVTGTDKYFKWDITNLVQDWVDGTETNYGATIRAEGGGRLFFSSREASSNPPILYVEYTSTTTPSPTPTPIPVPNQPPTLNLQASPSSGTSPLAVTFESSASDPDGSIVEYRWDTNGDGTVDEVTTSNPYIFVYLTAGTFNAKVTVVDNGGLTASGSVTVTVSSPPDPTPTPTPSPTPTPTPTPNPDPDQDSGVSYAPLYPANKVIKTVCSSGCNYTTISDSINASSAGWTIQVKNGIYNEMIYTTKSCTETQPCALMAYPGHSPVIDGTGKKANGMFLRGSWWIIDGFEITNAKYDGLKVDKPHNTLRNNHVHHNNQSGIKLADPSDILVENNISEFNGTGEGQCLNSGVSSPKHCHALYLDGRADCSAGSQNITIRRNTFRNQGGAGFQINNAGCSFPPANILIENNLIYNTANGFNLVSIGNAAGRIIRNNTVVLTANRPTTNETLFRMFTLDGTVRSVKIYNNIFYATASDVRGIYSSSTNGNNDVNYNLWNVVSNNWTWDNSNRTDFKTNYKSLTSWDANSECCEVDPKFISVTNKDYGITYYSPARNTGTNSQCAAHDKDGFPRPEEGICDMGMYELVP